MNRQEFLWELRACLNGRMPPAKLEDVIAYYEEYFLESGEEGEAAVMAELGDPREVAARILSVEAAPPPPPAWENTGFANYNTRRAPHRARGPRLAAIIAVLVGVAMVGGILLQVNGSVSRSTLVPVHNVPAPTVAPVPDYAASVSETLLSEHIALAPFSALELDLSSASVEIVFGDGYAIDCYAPDDNLKYESGPDGLRVWEDPARSRTNILPDIPDIFRNSDEAPWVVITVPGGASLADVTLRTGLGSLTVNGVSCRNLMLETALGEINLFDVTADQLGISLSGGSLNGRDIAAKEAKVTGSLGSLGLYNAQFDSLSVDWQSGEMILDNCSIGVGELHSALGAINANGLTSYGLRVFGQTGAICLQGALYGQTEVTQSLGLVEIRIDLARTDFSYDLQTTLGTITVDGRDDRGHVVAESDAPNRLTVQNASGSIDVSFSH